VFLDRIRLSGELGLIDEKILDFQRQTVGRDQVARGQTPMATQTPPPLAT
jgi:hypothetical protein